MKVAVRVRPLNDKEKSENFLIHWKTDGNSIFQVDPVTGRPKSDAFNFGMYSYNFSTLFTCISEVSI